jgi:hypothetical protein
MAAAAELSMVQLYRHIMKAAKQFPSIKKHSIIQQVKTEFRENKVNTLGCASGPRVCSECGMRKTPSLLAASSWEQIVCQRAH